MGLGGRPLLGTGARGPRRPRAGRRLTRGEDVPEPPFEHLLRLSDATGLLEHASYAVPRREHGYCVDDVARGLVVVAREAAPPAEVAALIPRYLAFVRHAQVAGGAVHNRLSYERRWTDPAGVGDHWGRALWGLGTVAGRVGAEALWRPALEAFATGASCTSPHPRSVAFAALGAAEVLARWPEHGPARRLVERAVAVLDRDPADDAGPWPEPRLTYANALLPEGLLAAGAALGDDELVGRALDLLTWLVSVELSDGRVSVTPVGGWAPGEPRPAFDQQPIEVAALADAAARAHDLTGEARWAEVVRRCAAWFLGDNDVGVPLLDEATGGGCDALTPDGRNENQGAESTLALISTLQQARRLSPIE